MGKANRRKERTPVKSTTAVVAPEPLSGILPYAWLIPLLLSVLVNANVLLNGFAWDDHLIILEEFSNIPRPETPGGSPDDYFRPLIEWSYRFDGWVWGLNPFGLHLSVYLAHALTTLFFYLSVSLLLRLYRIENVPALLAASLFAVHPIHVEAVAWIAGRNDVFMALFMMIAFYAYLQYRRGASIGWTGPLFALGSVLGLLSKETAMPFLLAFPTMDYLLHRSGIVRWRGLRDPLISITALLLGSFLLYRTSHVTFPSFSEVGAVSASGRFITLVSGLGYYIKLLIIPHPLNLFVADLSTGTAAGMVLVIIGLAGLIFLIVILLKAIRTVYAVGGIWFMLAMAAPLAVPFMAGPATPVAERYAYLASGGFLLMESMAVWEWARWLGVRFRMHVKAQWAFGLALLVVGIFSIMTFQRNAVWGNEIFLWEDTVSKSPNSAGPRNNLGVLYRNMGEPEKAIEHYRRAVVLNPGYALARNNLGSMLLEKKRYAEAAEEFRIVLQIRPDWVEVHNNLGNALQDENRLAEAIAEYQRVLNLNPDHAAAHNNLGNTFLKQNRLVEAVDHYNKALAIKPGFAKAHGNLGVAYHRQKRFDAAIQSYRTALKIDPRDIDSRSNLAALYAERGRLPEAIGEFKKILDLRPDAEGYYNLGIAYGQVGEIEAAKGELNRALQLDPSFNAARRALEALSK